MSALFDLFSTPIWQTLSRAFFHSLWMGPILLAIGVMLLGGVSPVRTSARYLGLLILQLALVGLTCVLWGVFHHQASQLKVTEKLAMLQVQVDEAKNWSEQSAPNAELSDATWKKALLGKKIEWRSWLILVWMAGVVVCLSILLRDAFRVHRLQKHSGEFRGDLAERISPVISKLSKRLKLVRKVGARVVDGLSHPAVHGIFRPVVLLPIGFVEKATPKSVRAVLAHELAHIRRHDFLMNVIQRVAESLMFFNPAIWILGAMVRAEREAACDAMAAELLGAKTEYVEGVVEWVSNAPADSMASGYALALSGDSAEGMVGRVKRLLFPDRHSKLPVRIPNLIIGFGVVILSGSMIQLSAQSLTEVLSSKERMAVSRQLNKEANHLTSFSEKPYELHFSVRHEDGSVPSKKELQGLYFSIYNRRLGESSVDSVICNPNPERTTKWSIKGGVCDIIATSERWAPTRVLGVGPTGDEGVVEVEIVLSAGEPAWLLLRDEKGSPAADVELSLMYGGEGGTWFPCRSDSDGRINLNLTNPERFKVRVRDSKFSWREWDDIGVAPLESVPLELSRLSPIELKFRRRGSGKPVLGELREADEFLRDHSSPVGRTDEGGVAILNVLGEKDVRDFCFLSEEGDRLFLVGITPSDGSEQVIELPDPVEVSGWISLSEDGRFKSDQSGRIQIDISGTTTWKQGYSYGWKRKVKTTHVEGDRAFFSFRGVWPGSMTLISGTHVAAIDVGKKSIGNVVLRQSKELMKIQNLGTEKRDVVIRFVGLHSEQMNSKVKFHCLRHAGKRNPSDWKQGEIVNGTLLIKQLAIEKLWSLRVFPDGVDGFWFSEFRHEFDIGQKLPEKGKPIEFEIPVLPAGGIQVEALEVDGSHADDVAIGVSHESNEGEERLRIRSNSSRVSQHFVSPLPLGGAYRIWVSRGDSYACSSPIELSERHPFRKTSVSLKEGVTVSGRAEDRRGNPVVGVRVFLDFSFPGITYANRGVETDVNGEFQFRHVDLENGGTYEIKVSNLDLEDLAGGKVEPVGGPLMVTKANYKGLVVVIPSRK